MSALDDVKQFGRLMMQRGLVVGPGGNQSVRDGDRMICKPSGYDVDRVPDDQWSVLDLETGRVLSGPGPRASGRCTSCA